MTCVSWSSSGLEHFPDHTQILCHCVWSTILSYSVNFLEQSSFTINTVSCSALLGFKSDSSWSSTPGPVWILCIFIHSFFFFHLFPLGSWVHLRSSVGPKCFSQESHILKDPCFDFWVVVLCVCCSFEYSWHSVSYHHHYFLIKCPWTFIKNKKKNRFEKNNPWINMFWRTDHLQWLFWEPQPVVARWSQADTLTDRI